MKTTPLETVVEDEDKVLKCVREIKSELANQSLGNLQSQLTKLEVEQKVAREKQEAQTSATTQLQQQMLRIEQLCIKLNNDLNTLATKT